VPPLDEEAELTIAATADSIQGSAWICEDATSAIRLPVDLGAQSDLIGAHEPMSIEAVLAAQIGGSLCGRPE
jgi:hypothetical protein